MGELDKFHDSAGKFKDFSKIREAWKLTQSGTSGFDPQIDEGFELDYYGGQTLLTIELRMGVLREGLRSSSRIAPENLLREIDWMEKELAVIGEVLKASITTPT